MEYPQWTFAQAEGWERWLAQHHATSPGVWLRLGKRSSPLKTLSYVEAVEIALCFGWIDGQVRSLGAEAYEQKFTPRRPRSLWSKVNRARAEALIQSGRMRPAGLQEVERARRDGRWNAAYDSPSTAQVPADLQAALEACPKASVRFGQLSAQQRYSALHQIQIARTSDTRARRIGRLVQSWSDDPTPDVGEPSSSPTEPG